MKARMTNLRLLSILILFIAPWIGPAACQETASPAPPYDWLGVGPIYGYSTYYYPYYDYHPPYGTQPKFTGRFWNYAPPYYYEPYWAFPYMGPYYTEFRMKYPAWPWWIGAHRDLPKVLDIARAHSSMRVYWNGVWQPP